MHRRITAISLCLCLSVAAILFLSGCGGVTGSATVNSVTITPTAAGVAPGSAVGFTATVNVANATTSTSTSVIWEVNGVAGGNSTIGTIVSYSTNNQISVYTATSTSP